MASEELSGRATTGDPGTPIEGSPAQPAHLDPPRVHWLGHAHLAWTSRDGTWQGRPSRKEPDPFDRDNMETIDLA